MREAGFAGLGAPPGPSVVYCHMSGVQEYYEACRRHGADVAVELGDRPFGLRDFRVLDPSGNRIGFVRLDISLTQRLAYGGPAWIRMFDDAAGRISKLMDQIPRRLQIDDVVVRKLLALKLSRRSKPVWDLPSPPIK